MVQNIVPDIVQKINKLVREGDFKGALKRIRPLLKQEPNNPGLQNVAGICHAQDGSNTAAVPYFAKAVKLAPSNLEFRCNLALALVLSKKTEQAQAQIDRLLKDAPNDYRPYHYQAMLAKQINDYRAVAYYASRALERRPDLLDALEMRAEAKVELQQSGEAIEDIQRIIARKPDSLGPKRVLANHLSELGRREDALAEYEKMLEIDPLNPAAVGQFVQICPKERLDEARALVEKLAKHPPKSARDKSAVALAQANLHRRENRTEESMVYFKEMHRFSAKADPWDPELGWRNLEAMIDAYPVDSLPEILPERDMPRPILVVGLPRSGTTLLEMILSSAPEVAACGEMYNWRFAAKRGRDAKPEATDVEKHMILAEAYIGQLPELPPNTQAFVDKMPANYANLGPFLTAFPMARVVHLLRDPRDVALSMWTRAFGSKGMGYTNKLSWIADQANLYRTYMKHWEKAFPNHILSIRYEDIVSDMESSTRKIAEHCQIEWTEKMLAPQKNEARVRTASLWQVRQKVHTGSVGGWHVFGEDLAELTDNLDPELWPEVSTAQSAKASGFG